MRAILQASARVVHRARNSIEENHLVVEVAVPKAQPRDAVQHRQPDSPCQLSATPENAIAAVVRVVDVHEAVVQEVREPALD